MEKLSKRGGRGLFLFALFLIIFSLSANAVILNSANLDVTLISQDPDPAEPGRYVELRWKVTNEGASDIEDVVFEILPDYPFSLDASQSAIQDIGSVWGLQSGEKGVILYYKLRVDKDAIEGENEIKLKYTVKGSSVEVDYTIRIQTIDATISLDEITTIPSTIVPGQEAEVQVKMTNLADSVMEDVTLKLDLSDDDLPFAPIGSTTEKKIRSIDAGESKIITFDIIAFPDAESMIYKVPIELKYYDELDQAYSKLDIISLIIGTEPELSVGVETNDIYQSARSGSISFKLVNKGVTDIKFLNIKLKQSDDYTIISPAESYIGNVDSDDYETAEFKIYVKQNSGESLELPITIEFKDANNNEYAKDYIVTLKLYSNSEAKRIGVSSSNSTGSIILIIIIGAVAYYFWNKKKKKK